MSVDTVGIPCDSIYARLAVECYGERQQKLHIAPAAPVPAHGYGRLASGNQCARRGQRLAPSGNLQRDSSHDYADIARFTLDSVAQNRRGKPGLLADARRCLQRHLRCRDEPRFASREPEVAGLYRLALA